MRASRRNEGVWGRVPLNGTASLATRLSCPLRDMSRPGRLFRLRATARSLASRRNLRPDPPLVRAAR
jgi:hypothetical protein